MSISNLSGLGEMSSKENKIYSVSVTFNDSSNLFGNFYIITDKEITTISELREYIYSKGRGSEWKSIAAIGNIISNSITTSHYQPFCNKTIFLVSAPSSGTSISVNVSEYNSNTTYIVSYSGDISSYSITIYCVEV